MQKYIEIEIENIPLALKRVQVPSQLITQSINDDIQLDDSITGSGVNYMETIGNQVGPDNDLGIINDNGNVVLNNITTSPISKCNGCITCNRGFLDNNPVYFNQYLINI